MTTSPHFNTFLRWLIAVGILLFFASCSSVSKTSTPILTTPSTGTHSQIKLPQDVEDQLIHTMGEARKLGPANPLLLSTMYSLATFYREHEEYNKAEGMYQKALALKEQVYGPEHQDVALILHQYAALLRDAQRVPEATALEHRARKIQATLHQPHLTRH